MKKFLSRFLIFCIILYLLGLGVDWCLSRPFKKLESSPFGNWNDIYQKEMKNDILIMGTSRAYVQINPRILDSILQMSSYNLGCNGRTVDSQIEKYKIYRHRQKYKPQLILYELYPGSLDTSNGYEKIQYLPYLQDPYIWWQTRKTDHFSFADCFIPCWRYLDYKEDLRSVYKKDYFYKQAQHTLYKGFVDYDKPWDGSALAKIDTIHYLKNPNILKQFEAFLDDCHKEHIQVVFVLAPYYIEATKKIYDLDGMFKMYQDLADKHNCLMLNYFDDTLCYDTAYFYNATHLNRTGATLFSIQLAEDVKGVVVGH